MSTATDYLRAMDNASDYADSLLLALEPDALDKIDDLFNSVANRDEGLWTEMGVDPFSVVEDYSDIELPDRDIDWITGLAGLSAASTVQYFVEARDDTIIKPLAYREQVVGTLVLTKVELVRAGKRTVEVAAPEVYAAIQAKYLNDLSFLSELSNAEMYRILLENGAIRPIEQTLGDSVAYVTRMTNYRPGSPQFKGAVADLISVDSKRGLKAMNRRSVETLYTERQVAGEYSKLMVWITEGGKTTCLFCVDRGGTIQPYSQWILDGLPGSDVCLGGDMCRCGLAVV